MNDLNKNELESKIAFLERHAEELDRVILRMENRIDLLQSTVAGLEDSMRNLKEEKTKDLDPEKPPHY